jgi:hypothetical protein
MGLERGASAGLISDLSNSFYPVLLTYADWPDETIRIHSGAGNLSWGGETWIGAGKLVQFQSPEESGGLATSEASVHVVATLEDMMAERGKVIRNRSITVYFGTTTEPAKNILKTEPVELFTGYFDSRTGSISSTEDGLAHDMVLGLGIGPCARASATITHSYEDQISKYPTDTAGRHVQTANRLRYNPQSWPE